MKAVQLTQAEEELAAMQIRARYAVARERRAGNARAEQIAQYILGDEVIPDDGDLALEAMNDFFASKRAEPTPEIR